MLSLFHRSLRRRATVGLLGCFTLTIVGCAAPMTMKAGDADATSPTRGVAILFEERNPPQSIFRRYELYPDGSLKVGGGKVALMHQTDWVGQPSAEEIAAILTAADGAQLASGGPACAPELVDGSESLFTTIEYASPAVSRSFALEGRCPSLAPLREAFERAALVRFKRQLDALPEAGKQRSTGTR